MSLPAAREIIVGFYDREASKEGSRSPIEVADSDDEFEFGPRTRRSVDFELRTGMLLEFLAADSETH